MKEVKASENAKARATQENEDPWLAFLREETPYMEDAGFSSEVMKSLPPPRSRRQGILAGSFILSFFFLALGFYLSNPPILDLLKGVHKNPPLFWGFWVLLALLIFLVVEERMAEEGG